MFFRNPTLVSENVPRIISIEPLITEKLQNIENFVRFDAFYFKNKES